MDQNEFNAGLQRHLMKSELEYRAKMLPNGSNVDWLAEYCGSVKKIAEFLRSLGFRIQTIMDKEYSGETFQWVITTNGIIVYANSPYCLGLVAKATKIFK